MKLILPYFIILLFVLQFYLKKNSKKTRSDNENFLKRESRANMSRKKDISNLNYITIPDTLPFVDTDVETIKKAQHDLADLKEKKILNLTGMSNTDLKIEYGVANLSVLSEYDENFSKLCRAIVRLSTALKENGFDEQAEAFLEFGIKCGSDVSANYFMLAEYYLAQGNTKGLSRLKTSAEALNSLSKNVILKKLETLTP